jgi:ABC-type transport system involved in multi-copper enzyme maturation permease subunit
MILFAAQASWLNTWLTPLWMLGTGAALGLAVLLVLWLLLLIISRRGAAAIPGAVTEGPLLPIFVVTAVAAIFAGVGLLFALERAEIIESVSRLPFVGTQTTQVTLPAATDDSADPPTVAIPLEFLGDELRSFTVQSNADLLVSPPRDEHGKAPIVWQVTGGEDFTKQRGIDAELAIASNNATYFVAQNVGDRDTTATVTLTTAAKHPQASLIVITAVAVMAIFLFYFLVRWLSPKTAAIALATCKSEMSQPLFLILIGLGMFLLVLFMFVPYHTFGEDIKVLKDSGLTLIMVFAIFHAVWSASNSVAEEVEGRTAITVLSKPIGRRQFILGKFLGISWTSAVMFILLGLWFLIIVAYKPIYDARESANTDPTWQACQVEMVRTVPGLVLAFFETLVFAAVSVAISTRLPLLANLVICFAIYAFGHLTPLLVQSGAEGLEPVRFMAQFIATVLPVLDHFNVQAAVAAGRGVPMEYLGMATMYCVLYCGVALLLALLLFEDRDLG